jgi:hypothetical protein
MRRLAIVAGMLTVAALGAAPDAWAFKDHTRDGWLVGIAYGGGLGRFTTGDGQTLDAKRGATPQIRVGLRIAPRWMLGINYEGWLYELGNVEEKQRFSLQNVVLAASFFPGDPANASGGIFLRGGVGLGWGRHAIVPLEMVNGEIEQGHGESTDESGLGLMAGIGYEFRVAEHCAVGLAASADYLSISKKIFDDGLYFPVAVNVNYYF